METTPAEPESSEAEAQSQSAGSESPDQSTTEGDANTTTIPDKEDPPITTNIPPTKKPNLSIRGVRVANLAALSALASSLNQPTLVTLSVREHNKRDGEGQTEQGDGSGGEFVLLQPRRPEKEEEGQKEGEKEEEKGREKVEDKEGEKEEEKEGGKKGEIESEGKQTLDWLIRNPWEIVRCEL